MEKEEEQIRNFWVGSPKAWHLIQDVCFRRGPCCLECGGKERDNTQEPEGPLYLKPTRSWLNAMIWLKQEPLWGASLGPQPVLPTVIQRNECLPHSWPPEDLIYSRSAYASKRSLTSWGTSYPSLEQAGGPEVRHSIPYSCTPSPQEGTKDKNLSVTNILSHTPMH